jgi:predicted transposase YdaD
VFKTELSLEPVRADSVTFLRLADRILHLEFQVKVPQNKPMPLRMLNYWVRLYWQHNLPITQVLIWLKQTNNPAVLETQFQLESVRCGFQVVRMWEQPSEALLQTPGLLPLAVLCQSENPTGLLNQVASEVAKVARPGKGSAAMLPQRRAPENRTARRTRGNYQFHSTSGRFTISGGFS